MTTITSAIPHGISSTTIHVECHISSGLPSCTIVGLPDKSVREAKERVRSAITHSKFQWPQRRITINLAPSTIHKAGTWLDLPIAIAILAESHQIKTPPPTTSFVGELRLGGQIEPSLKILPILLGLQPTTTRIIIPNQPIETTPSSHISIHTALNLREATTPNSLPPLSNSHTTTTPTTPTTYAIDHIQGNHIAKRALTIALAGHHHILLSGSPGTGKTTLARAAHELLPHPTQDQITTINAIHQSSQRPNITHITTSPFISPHHTDSITSIIGGGSPITPGAISLAHHGILFLDELLEFPRATLETLRQPMESGRITLTRNHTTLTYPAAPIIIAATNPCPCGYLTEPKKPCTCTTSQRESYQQKLSGPLHERFSIQAHTSTNTTNTTNPPHHRQKPTQPQPTGPALRGLIASARTTQVKRQSHLNNTATKDQLLTHITSTAHKKLLQTTTMLSLSPRQQLHTLQVARTIADLEHSPKIKTAHVTEAISLRPRAHHR